MNSTTMSLPRSRASVSRAVAAALLVAGVATCGSTVASAADASAPTIAAGPLTITFGGFTALESVYRNHDETADIGSNYNTAIPFPDSALGHISEFRESARQSRFSMLVQGPHDDNVWRAESYLETDFLSSGVTSNSGESNSYTLRMRHFYGVLRNVDSGWYLLGGQDWSLATLSTSGVLAPRAEQIPLTIDAQYVVGFNWTRNPQLRLVKLIGDNASFGVSLESPQASFTTTGAPSTVITGNPGGSGGLLNNGGTSTGTNLVNYSIDFAPDVVAKFAISPGWGHYEVYGLGRGFRDRYDPTAGSVSGTNNTTWGGGIGVGAILPLTPMLSLQLSGLAGNGIGRYGSANFSDATIRPDGTVAAIPEAQGLLGLIFKPNDVLTLYVYGGEEGVRRTDFAYLSAGKTVWAGYGIPTLNNTGCDTYSSSAPCTGVTRDVKQLVVGEWWKAYQGSIGNFQIGVQYSYTDRQLFTGVDGVGPSALINMGFVSFRYYPYQR